MGPSASEKVFSLPLQVIIWQVTNYVDNLLSFEVCGIKSDSEISLILFLYKSPSSQPSLT